MYEVLDQPRMDAVKEARVRNRKHLPKLAGIKRDYRKPKWGAMILISGGTSTEKLMNLPCGSEMKICLTDRSIWEVFIPADSKENIKILAKKLDAIAYM
tara:strand:+ start:6986 stop:7282 length:297 start_codon:yes stop_codon:yes gene_type:complete